ncbi:MAG: tetratricopeptide repeat protein, partial [Acidobacteria bacterium]|nr:tetratricopeptide repeat protein [Acidobacteriota bacterium]
NVSDELGLGLTEYEKTIIGKSYTTNAEAERLYMKGLFFWNKRNIKDLETSIGYFNQAIEKDQNYAIAYSGLSKTYALMPLYGNFRPKKYVPLAKKAAIKALELDPELAEAHTSLAYLATTYDFDWKSAEREYKLAIALNPNNSTSHQWYAEYLAFSGKPDAALSEISKALELDPFSLVINRMKGNILGFQKKYDEAIRQLKKTEELYPENALVRFNIGDIFAAKRQYGEAVSQYLAAFKLDGKGRSKIVRLEGAFKKDGWKGFWTEYLNVLLREREEGLSKTGDAHLNSESIAYAYAATGNREKAIEFLSEAYEERDPSLVTIKMSGVYDILNEDPRYKALLRKIGLPE